MADSKSRSSEDKRSLIALKGGKDRTISISTADYRGFIAILLCVAFVVSIFTSNIDGIAALGPLAGAAATWYFRSKDMWRGE